MTLLEWLQRHVNVTINFPGGVGGQCVDACNDYLGEVLALPPVRADAASWAGKVIPGMSWEENGPTNAPPVGAVVIWRPNVPVLGIGTYGHCAVVLAADARVLLTADQNWAGKGFLSVWVHTYDGVAGWQKPTIRTSAGVRRELRSGAHGGMKAVAGASQTV